MPPKPERKPERNTPAWRAMKRTEANERRTARERKRAAEPKRSSREQENTRHGAQARGPTGLKRTPLKRRSAKKTEWALLYLAGLRFLISLDPMCRCCKERRATEGHHPARQQGGSILIFLPVCRRCHTWVEDHKNEAREYGWIWY